MGDIPVHNDSLRKAAVELVISGECLGNGGTHPVSQLGKVGMEVSRGDGDAGLGAWADCI